MFVIHEKSMSAYVDVEVNCVFHLIARFHLLPFRTNETFRIENIHDSRFFGAKRIEILDEKYKLEQ